MKILAASPSKTMMFTVVSNCPHLSRYSVNVTIVYNLPSWLFVKYGSVLCSMALHHPNSIPNLLSSLKNFHSNALALVSVLLVPRLSSCFCLRHILSRFISAVDLSSVLLTLSSVLASRLPWIVDIPLCALFSSFILGHR